MGLGTALTAGASIIGGLASKSAAKDASKPQTTTSEPWLAQQPYLKEGFTQAKDALGNALDMGTYNGQRVADLNQYQTQGADFAGNYAKQYGMPAAGALGAAGQQFLGFGQQFGGNASDIYANTQGDPTQQILANANAYANNPYVDGLIDASGRDVTRQLNEQALPSLARAASGSGNTNSTRAGVESAILQRGAADRLADTSNSIRSSFFGKGLDMAQGQYNQDLSNSLAANNQLLQAFQQGGNTILQGQQVAGNTFDQSQAAGGVYQGHNQAQLDAARQQFAEQQNGALDLTGKYQSIVGGNYGGTTTQSGQPYSSFGSFAQGALGGAMAGAGLYGKLGGFGTQTPVSPSLSSTTPWAADYSFGGARLGG